MKILWTFILIYFFAQNAIAQTKSDTTVVVDNKAITLSEVVVNNKLNVPAFIERVKNDTSFYKAFRNLHVLNFSSINDIRMNNSDGEAKASLRSKTQQLITKHCRSMQTLDEQVTGDFYNDDRTYNYYTAQMYASLFFTQGSICGENNIVAGSNFSTAGKSGIEKHKEQLKMLFFNPGKKINGIPFMSDKTEIFADDVADKYDMSIDFVEYKNTFCYVFKQIAKPDAKGDVVIDEMTTWFDEKTYDVLARNYTLSYDAGVYDFKVSMQVELQKIGAYLVPTLLRYDGNWKAIFKKRERGLFTAILYDFK